MLLKFKFKKKKKIQKYLSMPATAVPSERVFSNAGYILNKRRSTLDKNVANMLVTLHTNLKAD